MGVLDCFDDSGNAALAAVALWKSSKTQQRLLEIEEQREQDRVSEARKACLVARIVKEAAPRTRMSGSHDFYLEIENLGEAEARRVAVLLDGVAILEHPVIPKQQLPQPPSAGFTVGPQAHVRYILGPTQDVRGPFGIELEWQDDSGEVGRHSSTLTIF